MAFFRAFRVYPSPVEFMMMLQQTLPEPVFKVRVRGVAKARYVLKYMLDLLRVG